MVERIQEFKIYRIAVLGPESSGKTTLCKALSAELSWKCAPEFSRKHLAEIRRPYHFQDLEYIAEKQQEYNTRDQSSVICDTEMSTLRIWSLEKFNKVAPIISHFEVNQKFDHYLLCRPDLPWIKDPLRENPNDRERLFDIYVERLNHFQRPFTIVEGQGDTRVQLALKSIKELLN